VAEILEKMGFDTSRMDRSLSDLSRGMQQKVAIARALLTSPTLLLLDEPTTGLDPVSKEQVQEFVEYIREEHDATILLTTHDMEEADRICDRLAVIDQGKFVALDTPEKLKTLVPGPQPASMKDVFFHLTGKSMAEREAEAEKKQ
jgi:ABC-2 type transport system ATP-binding protein